MKSSDSSTDRARDFVGRDWAFAKLDDWLSGSNGPRTFFLAGGPGSGKSAIAARLVQMNAGEIPSTDYPRLGKDRLAFCHFCRAQVDTSLVPQRWIESLAVALARRYPVYAQALVGGAFAISEQSLDDARTKGVPESVLKQLASLRNINVLEKEELLSRIETVIGETAAGVYRRMILDHLIHKQVRHPSIEIIANQTVGTVGQESVVKNLAIESLNVGRLSPRVSFDEVVRLPLNVLCAPDFNETIVIVLDGLDEALTYGQENLVSLIADVGSHTQDLPAQVRLLLTSRPDPRVIHAIGTPSLDLIDDAPDDVDDVGKYVDGRLCKLPEAQRREWAARIARAGSGNFLYARHVLDDLLDVDGLLKPVDDLRLPTDLEDVYRRFLKRELGRTLDQWRGRYQKLLGVVAVSRDDGLTGEQLANVTGLPQSETDSILLACSQYLAPSHPEGRFRIYHESFREFLLSDATFRIYPLEAHFAIASFYSDEYENAWSQCDEDYALRHTPTHLIGAFRSATGRQKQRTIRAALARLLTNLSFLERKALKIGIDTVRSDLSSVIDEALLDAQTATILKSLLYILDSDVKTLGSWDTVRHPDFFVQQIYLRSMRLKALPVVQLCEEHLRRTKRGYLRMVWMSEIESPELERTLLGQHIPVVQAAATSDGKFIVSQTNTHDVIVWQLASGQQMHRLDDQRLRNAWRQPVAVAFTQDNRHAILESSLWITAWDLQTGKNVQRVRSDNASWTSSQKGGMWPLDNRRLLHWIGQGWEVLDAETLQTDRPLKIPTEHIAAAAVTSDGRRAILGSEDGAVQVWDVVDDRPDTPLRTGGSGVRSMKVTPNGRWIVLSTQDKDVEVWDLHTRSLKWRTSLQFAGPLALSPEGGRVAFAREDFSIVVWNIAQDKAEHILRGHTARINDLCMTSDGERVVSAANDGTVRIWNIAYPAKTSLDRRSGDIRSHGSRVTALTVTPDGKHALSGSIDGVKIWSVRSGITERTIASQNGWVDDIVMRTEANQAVVLSSRGYGQVEMTIVDESVQHDVKANVSYDWSGVRTAGVYDLDTWQEVRVADMTLGDIEEFKKRERDPARTLTPFGAPTSDTPVMIVRKDRGVSGLSTVLTRFEVEGPARDMYLLSARDIVGRIFVTDSRLIYFDRGASSLYARLWDYESEPQTITFDDPGDLRAPAATPDGRFLVLCAGDGSVRVVDLQARQLGASFGEHKARVYEVAIAPDGHTIISVSEDGVAFMWDLHTARQNERSFKLPHQAEIWAITADNQWAFVAPPQSALVQIPLAPTAGTDIRSLDGHTATVHDIAVSPDGERVLSASEDRTIKLWSLQSGQQLAAAILDQPARRAVFAVGGDLIMAGDAAGNVYCLRYSKPARTRQRGFQRLRKGPEMSNNDEESSQEGIRDRRNYQPRFSNT